jgi:hypothetical protein
MPTLIMNWIRPDQISLQSSWLHFLFILYLLLRLQLCIESEVNGYLLIFVDVL